MWVVDITTKVFFLHINQFIIVSSIRASEYAAIGIVDINSDDLYINSSQVEDLSKVETNCRPLAQSSELISFQNFNISECGAVASVRSHMYFRR